MALTENTPRAYQLGDIEDYEVAATAKIYEGAAVGENGSGYSRPLAAGDAFQGFAEDEADNTLGANGALRVRVRTVGKISLAVTGVAQVSNDLAPVYASDDGTFTLVSTSNSLIGWVSRVEGAGRAVVRFDVAAVRAGLHA